MDNNSWYTARSEEEWYAAAKSAPKSEEKKKRKKLRNARPAVKVTMIVVFVLVLVAASAIAFGDGKSDVPNIMVDNLLPPPQKGDSDSSQQPENPENSQQPEIPNGFTEDFRDFFSGYYVTDEENEGSNISRADTNPNLSLDLSSYEGKEELSLGQVYDKCINSIVGISATKNGNTGFYWGTGIIMTSDGYIITNAHIIEGTDSAVVYTADGGEYEALLVGEDTRSDIAVLKIKAKGLQAAEFGMSGELRVGDPVVAIGNPLGIDLSGTMTNGIISAISRDVLYDGHYMSLLQTNTAINEGNSGGPLINMYGQVIGITNMKMVADISSATIEGIGFAIPTTTVKDIVDDIIANGRVTGRPGIGLVLGAVPEDAQAYYGLPAGLYVTEVVAKSGAAAAGVQVGDVVTHINGKQVLDVLDVNLADEGYGVGDYITMTIFRDGETFDVKVMLLDMNDLY